MQTITPKQERAALLLARLDRRLSWRAFEETANEMLTLHSQILEEEQVKREAI